MFNIYFDVLLSASIVYGITSSIECLYSYLTGMNVQAVDNIYEFRVQNRQETLEGQVRGVISNIILNHLKSRLILIIDEGSTDDTPGISGLLARDYGFVKYIRQDKGDMAN